MGVRFIQQKEPRKRRVTQLGRMVGYRLEHWHLVIAALADDPKDFAQRRFTGVYLSQSFRLVLWVILCGFLGQDFSFKMKLK
jgi:hypothetical protein